jgi:hypothetical protein
MPFLPALSRPGLLFAACFALASGLVAAAPGWASHTSTRFVDAYCTEFGPSAIPRYSRAQAMSYALRARWEGYQWGGGCWNDNNIDDSPGDPPGDPSTGGEGGDCSGFTYKVWAESEDEGDAYFWLWGRLTNVHGPFSSGRFMHGDGAANAIVSKRLTIPMDAFASSTHIGILFAHNADGTDQIIEAKGEAYGTNIWTRTYRGNSAYGGVRRVGWSS